MAAAAVFEFKILMTRIYYADNPHIFGGSVVTLTLDASVMFKKCSTTVHHTLSLYHVQLIECCLDYIFNSMIYGRIE